MVSSNNSTYCSPAAREMETAFGHYLRRSADVFDLTKNYEVCSTPEER